MIDVSVIIITKNEEVNIRNCLESIKKQNHLPDSIEIIVVDNNSTDQTKEIARAYTDQVYNYGPERSSQRNFGVKHSSGKYVLYIDADMILSEYVISECVKKCENQGTVALYIPERIIGNGYWIRVRDFERSFYDATCIDCVRFVRKDKFLEIDGFDEALIGPEDWDFDRRIREVGRVDIIRSPLYHNEGRFDFKRYLTKKTYYAQSFGKYINKWSRKDKLIAKQLGFRYRYFVVFFEAGKWKRLLAHPWLSFGVYSLRFFVGLVYLFRRLQ